MRLDEGHAKGFFKKVKKGKKSKIKSHLVQGNGFFHQNIFMKYFMCNFHCLFIDSCNRLLGGLIGDQRGLRCL